MHGIHAHGHHGGVAEHLSRTSPTSGMPVHQGHSRGGEGARQTSVDQVDLSPEAQQFIDGTGHGKSAASPAHAARALISENPGLATLPFGKVVSAINHGTIDSLIADNTPADPGAEATSQVAAETGAVVDSGNTSTASTDGTSGTVTGENGTDIGTGETAPEAQDPATAPAETTNGGTAGSLSTVATAGQVTDPTASLIESLDATTPEAEQTAA